MVICMYKKTIVFWFLFLFFVFVLCFFFFFFFFSELIGEKMDMDRSNLKWEWNSYKLMLDFVEKCRVMKQAPGTK